MNLSYTVTDNKYETIKNIIQLHFHISNRLITKLKKENSILLNGSPTFINKNIKIGDIINISFDYTEDNSNIISKKMNLDILYEDDWLLIINKPYNIPVHPSSNHYEDSISNGVKYYFDIINLRKKIRPVNRIDKNTSGIVIFAKNEYIQEQLVKQMSSGLFIKEYIAIVEGLFDCNKKSDTINEPIARKENSIIERCVNKNGDISLTDYEVLQEYKINNVSISLLKCILKTGRTHQIRVHMSYIGHPLLGDTLYGGNNNIINRQALHSYKVSFIHPIKNEYLNICADLPDDLKNILQNKNDRF